MKHQFGLVAAAAALSFVACNQVSSDSTPAKESLSNDASDNVKIAYVFGSRLGAEVFGAIPTQVGEGISEDALLQGFNDAFVTYSDSTAKLQLDEQELTGVGGSYSMTARSRFDSIQPDSARRATLTTQEQMQAYMDSAWKALPVAPEAPVTGKPVKVSKESKNIEKFSYMFGVNFAAQIYNIGKQLDLVLSNDAAIAGIRDGHKMAKDTTFKGFFSADSINAINARVTALSNAARQKQMQEAQAEEAKLKAALAPLRGDTLADGMPAKMNPAVVVKGINVEASSLSGFANKPLLVFYFSATCGHCKHAAPEIVAIFEEFKAQGLNAVAVASASGSMKQIRQFMEGAKMEFPVVQDTERQFGELYSDGYVPKVYLVNPDGSYNLYKNFGNQKDELKADITALLKDKKNVEHKIDIPAPAEAPAAN